MSLTIVQTVYVCLYCDRALNALNFKCPSWKIWLSGQNRADNCRSVERENSERKIKEFEQIELQMLLQELHQRKSLLEESKYYADPLTLGRFL